MRGLGEPIAATVMHDEYAEGIPRRLSAVLESLRAVEKLCDEGAALRVGQLVTSPTDEATPLPALLLALPFLTPVSMGPLTAPASLVIFLFGVGFIRGSRIGRLPSRVADLRIPRFVVRGMRTAADRSQRWVGAISRPRLSVLVRGTRGRVICGIGMALAAVLLAIPIPFLPLTNTLPAAAIICFGLGWLERDGALTLAGATCVLLGILIFSALGAGAWVGIRELVHG